MAYSYPDADSFFSSILPIALTYDDVSLATHFSATLPHQTQLTTPLTESLSLSIPIISSDMDTVTEASMAIAMALHGGMGLIHCNMDETSQVKHVARVKNHVHGLIQDPITAHPDATIGDVLERIEAKNYGFSTFPVINPGHQLIGLLSSNVVKPRFASKKVSEAMVQRPHIPTLNESELDRNPIQTANDYFNNHLGIDKLIVVGENDILQGLFTLSDIDRIQAETSSQVKPARDSQYQLVCGASLATPRNNDGQIDQTRFINHISQLKEEGIDAVAISTAHGHTQGVGDAIKLIRSEFKELAIIAGNVTSPEGVEYLGSCGADIIKIGQGPGSICTTRVVAGVGIPQLTALYQCQQAAKKTGVKLIADGGINKSGDIVKALTLADTVMLGGMLAGCKEAPGRLIELDGKLYKEYRGMGSLEAMKAGSAARYGHDPKRVKLSKSVSEGIEALKEVTGTVDEVINQLTGGIRSGMGYLGANNLNELKANARYVQITGAGLKESKPHDVIELKTSDRSS